MKDSEYTNHYIVLLSIFLLLISYSCCKKLTSDSEIPYDDNTITVCKKGGEYTLSNGIKLRIPKGAVTKKKNISINLKNKIDLNPIIDKYDLNTEDVLVYLEGSPDGITFNSPIDIIISSEFKTGEIPLIYDVINDTTCTIGANIKTSLDSENKEIIISVSHFSSFFLEIITELRDLLKVECLLDPCRCEKYLVEQKDKDFICNNGGCQISESKVIVTFPKCEGFPKEVFSIREVSDGCTPNLEISSADYIVPTEGQTIIDASVKIDCEPLEGQSIDFSKSSSVPANLNPTYSESNSDGNSKTIFTAGDEEGTVTVNARSTVSYFRTTLLTTAGGETELVQENYTTKELKDTINILIRKPHECWSGKINYDLREFTDCYEVLRHYDIDYKFYVFSHDHPYNSIGGQAVAHQNVTISGYSINCGHCYFDNINIPETLNLSIGGTVGKSDSLFLYMEKRIGSHHFFTYRVVCNVEGEVFYDQWHSYAGIDIGLWLIGDKIIPLKEGTYSNSFTFFGTGKPLCVGWDISYTIVLNKDE